MNPGDAISLIKALSIGEQEKQPDDLCRNCGKCCKAIIPKYSYEKLLELAAEDNEQAKVFTEFFKRHDSLEDVREIAPGHVEQIIEILKEVENFDINKVSFYYCPNVTEDNRCPNYENRPDCCRVAPKNGWSIMPPGCGFEGWQFEYREKYKRVVRRLKEYIYELDQTSNDGKIQGTSIQIEEFKNIAYKHMKWLNDYGANEW